jgi:hypothetical protein
MRPGVCLVLAAALAACGPAPTDGQIARRAVITRHDLPAGWRYVQSRGAIRCPMLRPTRHATTAVVQGPVFARRREAELSTGVWMFPSTAAARRGFAMLAGGVVARCYTGKLMRAFAAKSRFVLGRAARTPVALGPVGDARAASRVAVNISQGGATGTLNIDTTYVRRGRAVVTGVFVGAGAPLDPALRTRLLRAASRRLSDGLDLRT